MKKILIGVFLIVLVLVLSGCEDASEKDMRTTFDIGNKLANNQPTPIDIDYSLERYNLIRRTYWVNGMREKANALPCPIQKPFGYIILFTESGSIVGHFVVDGKVTSLNAYLTPDSDYYEASVSKWLPDVDGAYGENDNGIFFFDIQGNYIEWTGTYLYTDIPMKINDPVVKFEVNYGDVK